MQGKILIQHFMEQLWNKKDLSIVEEVVDENAIIHSPLKTTKGPKEFQEIAKRWLSGFPDIQCKWEDWICEGDKVVVRWLAKATHKGAFLDFPASGKTVHYSGVSIYRLENNKIVEYWGVVDMQALMSQIKKQH